MSGAPTNAMASAREVPHLSVIVPAYNAAAFLPRCLDALVRDRDRGIEIIVCNNGSSDETGAVALRPEVRVISLEPGGGPAVSRNAGARASRGDLLLFVDADVVIAQGTLARVHAYFAAHPDCDALFGSYDDRPDAPGIVSQYRNLLHHFVHQRANAAPSHFWSGLGAIRRDAFLALGGFDEHIAGVEDVELGYRLRRAGRRVHLDPTLQAKHLKRWTLRGMLWTDVMLRAVPWTRLLLGGRTLPGDFSLGWRERASVLMSGLLLGATALALWRTWFLLGAALFLVAFVTINVSLLRFFVRQRGVRFAFGAGALHLLYNIYSGIGFVYGSALYVLRPGGVR